MSPNAEDTLKHLRIRGYKLGILTNGSSQSQRAKIDSTPFADLVDTILVSGEEGVHKPDSEIYWRATHRLNVDAKDCVFIGDNPNTDIIGAHKVSMTSVWIQKNFTWSDSLGFSPDYTISDLNELLKIKF